MNHWHLVWPPLQRTSPETTHARQTPGLGEMGWGTYDLFLGEDALVEVFVNVLHVHEKRANAARRETSDVMFQAL